MRRSKEIFESPIRLLQGGGGKKAGASHSQALPGHDTGFALCPRLKEARAADVSGLREAWLPELSKQLSSLFDSQGLPAALDVLSDRRSGVGGRA